MAGWAHSRAKLHDFEHMVHITKDMLSGYDMCLKTCYVVVLHLLAPLWTGIRLRILETDCFSAGIYRSRLLFNNHRSSSCWLQVCSPLLLLCLSSKCVSDLAQPSHFLWIWFPPERPSSFNLVSKATKIRQMTPETSDEHWIIDSRIINTTSTTNLFCNALYKKN